LESGSNDLFSKLIWGFGIRGWTPGDLKGKKGDKRGGKRDEIVRVAETSLKRGTKKCHQCFRE